MLACALSLSRTGGHALWQNLGAIRSFATDPVSSPVTNTRWGILSAGKIAADFCKALHVTPGAQPYAVAARDADKAAQFAQQHNVDVSYGGYEALLADPAVNVVYVGSVADQHARLALMALEAGKATVVEKPLTLSYKESKRLVDLAKKNQTFLMEGMWTRCFPASRQVRQWIAQGRIGQPFMIQGDFGWSTTGCGPDDRIWYPHSGGLILDVAMYLAQWGTAVYGPNARVDSMQAMGTTLCGVDHTTVANCRFQLDDDINQYGFLQFYVSGQSNTEERLVIQGTKGRIVIEPPAHIPTRVRLELDTGRGSGNVEQREFTEPDDSFATWNYPGSIGFRHQIEAVNQALHEGRLECPEYTWKESLQVAALLDDMRSQIQQTAPIEEDMDGLAGTE